MLCNSVAFFSISHVRPVEKSCRREEDGNQARRNVPSPAPGLIFFFEKNFHEEYIVVFVCIRLEFPSTLSISMCMRFHSERTTSWVCPTLSYSISIFSLFAIYTGSRSKDLPVWISSFMILHFARAIFGEDYFSHSWPKSIIVNFNVVIYTYIYSRLKLSSDESSVWIL